jgi:CBS domain
VRAMQEHQIRRIPVVDGDGSCIGIIAQADIALKDQPDRVSMMVTEISRPAPRTVAARNEKFAFKSYLRYNATLRTEVQLCANSAGPGQAFPSAPETKHRCPRARRWARLVSDRRKIEYPNVRRYSI